MAIFQTLDHMYLLFSCLMLHSLAIGFGSLGNATLGHVVNITWEAKRDDTGPWELDIIENNDDYDSTPINKSIRNSWYMWTVGDTCDGLDHTWSVNPVNFYWYSLISLGDGGSYMSNTFGIRSMIPSMASTYSSAALSSTAPTPTASQDQVSTTGTVIPYQGYALSGGTLAGIVVSAGITGLALLALAGWQLCRKGKASGRHRTTDSVAVPDNGPDEDNDYGAELHTSANIPELESSTRNKELAELQTSANVSELASSPRKHDGKGESGNEVRELQQPALAELPSSEMCRIPWEPIAESETRARTKEARYY